MLGNESYRVITLQGTPFLQKEGARRSGGPDSWFND